MKKVLLVIAIALSMSAFAKDEQKIFVQSGDLSFLKEPVLVLNSVDFSKTIVVEFEDDKVKLVHGQIDEYNAERGEDYVNDWSNVQKRLRGFGLDKLNNKKGLLNAACTKEEVALLSEKEIETYKKLGAALPIDKEIKYECRIVVDTIDLGNGAAMAVPFAPVDAGGCIITGSMEIVNKESGATVCSLRFHNCKGWGNVLETNRIGLAIREVYKEMLKQTKKKK